MRYLLFIFLLTCGVNAFGATYYVSKAGNNTTGLSWAAAWNDTTSALDSLHEHMAVGDTAYFGAGTWLSTYLYCVLDPPWGGASPTDRTCYACSSFVEGLATISGAEEITGWTLVSGNIYRAYFVPIASEVIYTLAEDDSLLAMPGSLEAIDEAGEFWYNSTIDSIYAWLFSGDDPDEHTMYASNRIIVDMITDSYDYITLWGLKFKYGNKVGIRIGGTDTAPDSVHVEHCEVSHVSGQSQQNTAGISTRTGGGDAEDTLNWGRGNIIRGCNVHDIREQGSWYGHTKCLCFYGSSYLLIESCYVDGSGIGINVKGQDQGDQDQTYLRNNIIRYNTVVGSSNGIDLTCWHVDDSIYGNVIYDLAGDKWGITVEGYGDSDDGTVVYNNSIVGASKAFVPCPWYDDYDGTGVDGMNYFKYNIISSPGSSLIAWIVKRNDTVNIMPDSNLYYYNSVSFYTGNDEQTGRTLSDWTSVLGFDTHSDWATDPGFINAGADDYRRTDSLSADMDLTYGGKRYTLYGAWQPTLGESADITPAHLSGKTKLSGKAKIE